MVLIDRPEIVLPGNVSLHVPDGLARPAPAGPVPEQVIAGQFLHGCPPRKALSILPAPAPVLPRAAAPGALAASCARNQHASMGPGTSSLGMSWLYLPHRNAVNLEHELALY